MPVLHQSLITVITVSNINETNHKVELSSFLVRPYGLSGFLIADPRSDSLLTTQTAKTPKTGQLLMGNSLPFTEEETRHFRFSGMIPYHISVLFPDAENSNEDDAPILVTSYNMFHDEIDIQCRRAVPFSWYIAILFKNRFEIVVKIEELLSKILENAYDKNDIDFAKQIRTILGAEFIGNVVSPDPQEKAIDIDEEFHQETDEDREKITELKNEILSELFKIVPPNTFLYPRKKRRKIVKKATRQAVAEVRKSKDVDKRLLKLAASKAATEFVNIHKRVTRDEQMKDRNSVIPIKELYQLINCRFPGFEKMLDRIEMDYAPKSGHEFDYEVKVALMIRILMATMHINSMRGMTEEFYDEIMIENIAKICGCKEELERIPHHDTINNYLKHIDPQDIQQLILDMVKMLMRSKAFDAGKVNGKHWHLILDGTQLCTDSRKKRKLTGGAKRIHNKGTPKEYTENYWYVLELKIVLMPGITVSLMTEFIENQPDNTGKQDCEINAAKRLLKKLKKEFPKASFLIGADSLYACKPIFDLIHENGWNFIINFEEKRIPSVTALFNFVSSYCSTITSDIQLEDDEKFAYKFLKMHYDNIEFYLIEYRRSMREHPSYVITDLDVSAENVEYVTTVARRRWNIESCFNEQKNHGYYLTHVFCYDYTASKNHYLLIQIGHMISQLFDAYIMTPKMKRTSREKRHRWLLTSAKSVRLGSIPDLDRVIHLRLPLEFWEDECYFSQSL